MLQVELVFDAVTAEDSGRCIGLPERWELKVKLTRVDGHTRHLDTSILEEPVHSKGTTG